MVLVNIKVGEMIEIALSQYGVKEIDGEAENKTIVDYSRESGFMWVSSEDTPWCSIFINWVALKAGYERTEAANARSWLKIGQEIEKPRIGDVVVFKRGNSSWQGHVGLFIREDGDKIYCLGGNQGNQVNIRPYSKKNLLGYRRLNKVNIK